MYVVIAGGGLVGGGLARELLANKYDVVIIDPDQKQCDKLYTEIGVVAVCGHASRIEVLKDAGIEKADIVVAATAKDTENLACVILAKSMNVPLIIARMRDQNYENAYKVAGVNTIVRVTDMMINQMIMEIENPQVRKVTTIGGGRANIFAVRVPEGASVAGKKVKEIVQESDFPAECVFMAVYNHKEDTFSMVRGSQSINAQDEIFLTAPTSEIKKVVDKLTARPLR